MDRTRHKKHPSRYNRRTVVAIGCGLLIAVTATVAGIPEPDVLLHGRLYIDGVLQQSTDELELIARVDGVADPVGSYRMGDLPAAGNDYVLRIRVESLADGSTQSSNAVVVGQTVHINATESGGPEELITDYVVEAAGVVVNLQLGERLAGDMDGDGDIDLEDYAAWPDCETGPGEGGLSPECDPLDVDLDGDVDLDDFAAFQQAFTG